MKWCARDVLCVLDTYVLLLRLRAEPAWSTASRVPPSATGAVAEPTSSPAATASGVHEAVEGDVGDRRSSRRQVLFVTSGESTGVAMLRTSGRWAGAGTDPGAGIGDDAASVVCARASWKIFSRSPVIDSSFWLANLAVSETTFSGAAG